MAIAVAFSLMGAFFMVGLYVAGALGVLAMLIMFVFSDAPLANIMANRAWTTYTNFLLVAIPLFILMGELVLRSGFAARMYSALNGWVSPIPGGLLHTNIASCAVFAACAGSSIATAATISRVALPTFRARGYNERMVVGSLAAGGTLGILIPPSILLVLYGLTTGVSIGRLFLAGFIPGAILAGSFMLMIGIASIVWPGMAPKEPGPGYFSLVGWRDRILGTLNMVPIFVLVFAVLGSIYGGWATPTEAAAWGVSGAALLAVIHNSEQLMKTIAFRFVEKSRIIHVLPGPMQENIMMDLRVNKINAVELKHMVEANITLLTEAFMSTVRTTAMIMLILLAAFTIQFAFARLGISIEMAEWITGLNLSAVEFVLILVVFYLVLGTFMESYSMMMTTLPILLPSLIATDVDRLWFGIIMIILLEAAQISPPQGLALYVLQGARNDISSELSAAKGVNAESGTINDVYIGVMPFMLCMLVVIGIIIAFPQLATWLPDQVKGPRL